MDMIFSKVGAPKADVTNNVATVNKESKDTQTTTANVEQEVSVFWMIPFSYHNTGLAHICMVFLPKNSLLLKICSLSYMAQEFLSC